MHKINLGHIFAWDFTMWQPSPAQNIELVPLCNTKATVRAVALVVERATPAARSLLDFCNMACGLLHVTYSWTVTWVYIGPIHIHKINLTTGHVFAWACNSMCHPSPAKK